MEAADLAERRPVAEHVIPVDVTNLPSCRYDRYGATAAVLSPFVDALTAIGWKPVTGHLDHASAGGREAFVALLIKSDLRKVIERVSLSDDKPRLDNTCVAQAIGAPDVAGLLEPSVVHCGFVQKSLGRRLQVINLLTEGAT